MMTLLWHHLWILNSVTLAQKSTRSEQCAIVVFCGQNDFMQIWFTLRCIQYTEIHVLWSQQYMLGGRKCKLGRNLHQILSCNQSFFDGFNSSQHRLLHREFRNLVTDGTDVWTKLEDILNKKLVPVQ